MWRDFSNDDIELLRSGDLVYVWFYADRDQDCGSTIRCKVLEVTDKGINIEIIQTCPSGTTVGGRDIKDIALDGGPLQTLSKKPFKHRVYKWSNTYDQELWSRFIEHAQEIKDRFGCLPSICEGED